MRCTDCRDGWTLDPNFQLKVCDRCDGTQEIERVSIALQRLDMYEITTPANRRLRIQLWNMGEEGGLTHLAGAAFIEKKAGSREFELFHHSKGFYPAPRKLQSLVIAFAKYATHPLTETILGPNPVPKLVAKDAAGHWLKKGAQS